MTTDSYNFCRFAAAESAGRGLVAVAGSDTAALELWDVDAGVCCSTFAPAAAGVAAEGSGAAPGKRAGMLMAVRAHVESPGGVLYVLAGYEDGWCATLVDG